MRLILLGAPGAGKGTQAKALAKELNIPHICSGDLLRQVVRNSTALGKQAKGYMEKGELVPDTLVDKLVFNRINQPDAETGFVLDGYPRNVHQAAGLEEKLAGGKGEIDTVINLEASQEVIIQRLSGRRICSGCQANFHVKNMPPKKEGICDYCEGLLYQRPDDKEETIKNRLRVYRKEAESLIDFYKKRSRLLQIQADEEADIVLKKILDELNGNFKISARD
ncbi:MAG: adenylate kinase [Candidatus Omnitrophota bacterium]